MQIVILHSTDFPRHQKRFLTTGCFIYIYVDMSIYLLLLSVLSFLLLNYCAYTLDDNPVNTFRCRSRNTHLPFALVL